MSSSKMRHCLELSSWIPDQYLFFFTQIQKTKQSGFQSLKKEFTDQCVGLIFQEPSTRTRVSYQKAIDHIGATSYIVENNSSLAKGETLADTIKTLQSMGIHHFIVRTSTDEIFEIAKCYQKGFLINAGSGTKHHPTQGLLDAFTIWENFGKLEGLQIVLLGDLMHSRVARSNLAWMKAFGIKPTVCGPASWVNDFEPEHVIIEDDMTKAIENADVVMLHRIQKERFREEEDFQQEEYFQKYCMTIEKLTQTKKDAIVMHPGPINRGIELSTDVADHEKSKILQQVENGLWTRICLLQTLLRAGSL